MPRYHFHITDGERKPDNDGTELLGLAVCRIEAVRLFGEILSDRPEELWSDREMKVEVTDDRGVILFVLQLTAMEAPEAFR